MTYNSVGSTNHYSIFYDASPNLSKADGENRAKALKAVCEQDFVLMAGWFAGVTIKYPTPFEVRIEQGGGFGASWGSSPSGALYPISLSPDSGDSLDLVRYLLVAEVTEIFMQSQGKGYFADDGSNEASIGEGLSLFLATQFLVANGLPPSAKGISRVTGWFKFRPDWVSKTENSRTNAESYGCALLFLYYLNVQLGFDINGIIAAAATKLSGVYTNLTGDTVEPFTDFLNILKNTSAVLGSNPDNPFPLPSPQSLSVNKYISALAPDPRNSSIRSLLARSGKHTLRPTLNSNRRAVLT